MNKATSFKDNLKYKFLTMLSFKKLLLLNSVLLLFIAFSAAFIFIYISNINNDEITKHEAIMDFQYELSEAHLSFHEYISEDKKTDLSLIFKHLDNAEKQLDILDSKYYTGVFSFEKSEKFKKSINKARKDLLVLRNHFDDQLKKAQIIYDIEVNEDIDKDYKRLLKYVFNIEDKLHESRDNKLKIITNIAFIVLIIVIIIIATTNLTLLNLEKQRKENQLIIEKQNQELINANIYKNLFLSTMSHELRTPLNAIIGYSQVMEKGLLGNLSEKQLEYISTIKTSGEHLLSLINDILDISLIEKGELTLIKDAFSIENALNEVLKLIVPQAKAKNIELCSSISPELTSVLGDRKRFKQIILNILTNAVKFTPDNGKITLIAEKNNNETIKISITDTGIGIKKEELPNVFNEFYQAKGNREKYQGSIGLGLTLIKKLVELHDGEISVESTPGTGTTFYIVFPVQ